MWLQPQFGFVSHTKVDVPNKRTTPIFEWCVVECEPNDEYQNDMC
jgi:hypothetical protein